MGYRVCTRCAAGIPDGGTDGGKAGTAGIAGDARMPIDGYAREPRRPTAGTAGSETGGAAGAVRDGGHARGASARGKGGPPMRGAGYRRRRRGPTAASPREMRTGRGRR